MDPTKDFTLKRYFSFVWRTVLLLIFGLLLLLAPVPVSAYEIVLGTNEVGTFSYFSGRMLCRIVNSQVADVRCSAEAADNEIDNLTNLQSGALDLAIIDSQLIYRAKKKLGVFQFLDISYENLAILTPLFDLPIGVIVRRDAGITTLNDLVEKRINGGSPGSLQHRAMKMIMKAKGWSVDDFELFEELSASQSQDTMAFCQGTVQAMMYIGVHPNLLTQRILKNCKAQLLNMDDNDIKKLIDTQPPLWKTVINAQSYPTHSNSINTLGSRAILVGSSDFDQETVYTIVKALYDNKERLKSGHPALSLYPAQEAGKGIEGLKLHKGAEQFFSEQ